MRRIVLASTPLIVALLLLPREAVSENIVIPPDVSGLLTVEYDYTEADFVDGFGIIEAHTGGDNPCPISTTELLDISTTRIGRRVLQREVAPGDTLEFYIEANKGDLPGFSHTIYSSDPAWNVRCDADPDFPEHILAPQQLAPNRWVLRWEDKNSHDPGFDRDFNDVVVSIRVGGDRDGDGLWDDWEESGIDMQFDGVVDLPLNAAPFNANPDHKDVYLEIDWMVGTDGHSHAPVFDPACDPVRDPLSLACSASVVPRLVAAFANAPGIFTPTVHPGSPCTWIRVQARSTTCPRATPLVAATQSRRFARS